MATGALKATLVMIATSLTALIMPPHRKEWAEAMLNEIAYVDSTRQMLPWIFGSVLSALKARAPYELETTIMRRGILKTSVTLSALLVVALIGMYTVLKPYQRERIKLAVIHQIDATPAPSRK